MYGPVETHYGGRAREMPLYMDTEGGPPEESRRIESSKLEPRKRALTARLLVGAGALFSDNVSRIETALKQPINAVTRLPGPPRLGRERCFPESCDGVVPRGVVQPRRYRSARESGLRRKREDWGFQGSRPISSDFGNCCYVRNDV